MKAYCYRLVLIVMLDELLLKHSFPRPLQRKIKKTVVPKATSLESQVIFQKIEGIAESRRNSRNDTHGF